MAVADVGPPGIRVPVAGMGWCRVAFSVCLPGDLAICVEASLLALCCELALVRSLAVPVLLSRLGLATARSSAPKEPPLSATDATSVTVESEAGSAMTRGVAVEATADAEEWGVAFVAESAEGVLTFLLGNVGQGMPA